MNKYLKYLFFQTFFLVLVIKGSTYIAEDDNILNGIVLFFIGLCILFSLLLELYCIIFIIKHIKNKLCYRKVLLQLKFVIYTFYSTIIRKKLSMNELYYIIMSYWTLLYNIYIVVLVIFILISLICYHIAVIVFIDIFVNLFIYFFLYFYV